MPLAKPKALEEREIVALYGKRVFFRDYALPNEKISDFLLWGAAPIPVIGMPVTNDGDILLVKQFRCGVDDFVFEFPGGCPKQDQAPEEALRVEIDQEVGYSCGEIHELASPIPFEPAACTTRFIPFLVTGCAYAHEPRPDPTEILEVVKMSQESFFDNVSRLPLDAKTLTIAFLALSHLGYTLNKK